MRTAHAHLRFYTCAAQFYHVQITFLKRLFCAKFAGPWLTVHMHSLLWAFCMDPRTIFLAFARDPRKCFCSFYFVDTLYIPELNSRSVRDQWKCIFSNHAYTNPLEYFCGCRTRGHSELQQNKNIYSTKTSRSKYTEFCS